MLLNKVGSLNPFLFAHLTQLTLKSRFILGAYD